MALNKDYEDIPGTFVFDADRGREGYQLNQFCISLRLQKNRETFSSDERAYLDSYAMAEEQRQAVLDRDWNRMLELGGNIYYTSKLAANDGINFQQLAGLMTGMGNEAYREMMVTGGRSQMAIAINTNGIRRITTDGSYYCWCGLLPRTRHWRGDGPRYYRATLLGACV